MATLHEMQTAAGQAIAARRPAHLAHTRETRDAPVGAAVALPPAQCEHPRTHTGAIICAEEAGEDPAHFGCLLVKEGCTSKKERLLLDLQPPCDGAKGDEWVDYDNDNCVRGNLKVPKRDDQVLLLLSCCCSCSLLLDA